MKLLWWMRRRQKEDDLREELEFHLSEEAEEREADGLSRDAARAAARCDLGNVTLLQEETRALWTWTLLEQFAQDARYALRTMARNRAVSAFAVLSLAMGIGAGTAIYSFMDAILLRQLPIADPASLVELTWRAKPIVRRTGPNGPSEFVLRSIDGRIDNDETGAHARIFPFAAVAPLRNASAAVFSSMFTYFSYGRMNILMNGDAELADVEYVSGDFFLGLAVPPAAGRTIDSGDDRPGAPPVAVLSHGYAQRRFGAAAQAVGQRILVNNHPFTVAGVAPPEFFGVDPASAPCVYLPLTASLLLDPDASARNFNPNYYWIGIMGRLRPGVTLDQAQAALAPVFANWVLPTASTVQERANLPQLRVDPGGRGIDTLRTKYSKPLYALMAMVGLILAIACANMANLLLARAAARRREIAVRLSIGAGRLRLIRQLLTESLVLAGLSGAFGIVIVVAGIRLLTVLLANGDSAFTLHAELNARVLAVAIAVSALCGTLFGLVPAIRSTRLTLVPALKNIDLMPRMRLPQALVVCQIALLSLLLVAAGLLTRTLANLQSVPLGFNPGGVLLFQVNAPQAGYPASRVAAFYDHLRRRFTEIPGVRAATLSHSSLIRAGRAHGITVDGVPAVGTRFLQTGPGFFSAMEIPILQGREIDERDRAGSLPVVVVSELFARTYFANQNPLGHHITVTPGGSTTLDLEVIGVAADARYGGLKGANPAVVYVPYPQMPTRQLQQMTFALRTDGDPLRLVASVRAIVRDADVRVPVTNVVTERAEIEQTMNQEIVLARLCTVFAIVALAIACVGLYGTLAYGVARRTREIGIRIALGARRGSVVWMVLRDVCVLAALGLAIGVPIARGTSKYIASFLFDMTPNDPRAIAVAAATLFAAALAAGYGPARRASRIDPTTALRSE
jgi:predicted permease